MQSERERERERESKIVRLIQSRERERESKIVRVGVFVTMTNRRALRIRVEDIKESQSYW